MLATAIALSALAGVGARPSNWRCRLCNDRRGSSDKPSQRRARSPATEAMTPPRKSPFQFGLLSLIGLVTLAAVVLANRESPAWFLVWTTALALGLPAVAFAAVLLYKATKHGRD